MPKPAKTNKATPKTAPKTGHRANEDRAQDLVYHAMEAPTPEDQVRLLNEALELDPANVDALLMFTSASGIDSTVRIEALKGIVEIGAKRLGKKAFKDFVPYFWGHTDTRPYMRARAALAEELRAAGLLDEAIIEYKEMLRLNENDNQGIRYHLLPCLLALKRMEELQALIDQFPDEHDWNVVFAWGRVLAQILTGETAAAKKSLAAARKQNPHMQVYVLGHRTLPKRLPYSYSPGSKEEAQCFAQPLIMAWSRHPEAVAWLSEQETPK